MNKIYFWELNVTPHSYELKPLTTSGVTKAQQYEMRETHLLNNGGEFAAVTIRANAETEQEYNRPLDHLSEYVMRQVCEQLGGDGAMPLIASNIKQGVFYAPLNEQAREFTRRLWQDLGYKASGRGHFALCSTVKGGVGQAACRYYTMPEGTRITATATGQTTILHDGSSAADDALFPTFSTWNFGAHRASADVLNTVDAVFTDDIFAELLDGYETAILYAVSDQHDQRRADAVIGQAARNEDQEKLFFDVRVRTRMRRFLAEQKTANARTLIAHPFLRDEDSKRLAAELFRLTTAGTLETAFKGYGGLLIAADTPRGEYLSEQRDVNRAVIVRHPALDSSSVIAASIRQASGFAPIRAIQTRNEYRHASGAFAWCKDFLLLQDYSEGATAITPDGTTTTIPPLSVVNCKSNVKWTGDGVIGQGDQVTCYYQVIAAINGSDCIGAHPDDIRAISGADTDDLIECLDLSSKPLLWQAIKDQPRARVVAKETKKDGGRFEMAFFWRSVTPRIVMAAKSGNVIARCHFFANLIRQMSRKQQADFCAEFFRMTPDQVIARLKSAWQAGLDGGKAQGAALAQAIRLSDRLAVRWSKREDQGCGYLRKDPKKWHVGRAIPPFLRLEIPTVAEMGIETLDGNVPRLIRRALKLLKSPELDQALARRKRAEKPLESFRAMLPHQGAYTTITREAGRLFRLYYQRWNDARLGLAGYRKAEGDDVSFRYLAEDFNRQFLTEIGETARQIHLRSRGTLTSEEARKRLVCALWHESHDERRDGSLCFFLFEQDLMRFASRAA